MVNADLLRADLESRGVTFETSSDSEVIAALLANAPGETWEERFELLMRRASGAYCLTVLTLDAVFGVRDPYGIRPLCIGRLNDDGGGYVFASESCALDHLGAEFIREVEPGEVVRLDRDGLHSFFPGAEPARPAMCLFGVHLLRTTRLAHRRRAVAPRTDAHGRATGRVNTRWRPTW